MFPILSLLTSVQSCLHIAGSPAFSSIAAWSNQATSSRRSATEIKSTYKLCAGVPAPCAQLWPMQQEGLIQQVGAITTMSIFDHFLSPSTATLNT